MEQERCLVCKAGQAEKELVSSRYIRHEIRELILEDHPCPEGAFYICRDDYDIYRMRYISRMVELEQGNIEALEKAVINSINQNELLSLNLNEGAKKPGFGERLSDRVAMFGGSWKFIISFFVFMTLYILLNVSLVMIRPFDPYPFILLNLMLSCIAAIQAPIIMMSQNRQEAMDRIRAEHDYKINLKSEIEVRTLHEKVDHLLLEQWTDMMEVQRMQLEILQEVRLGIANLNELIATERKKQP